MKGSDLVRIAIVLATLGYLFGGDGGGKPKPEPCVPCGGGAIHRADDWPSSNQPQHGRTRPHLAE